MSASGLVKSVSKNEYGFIKCDAVKEQYGRDAFFHKSKLPEEVFAMLRPACKVDFEYQLSLEGKPQVTAIINVDGQPTGTQPTMAPGAVYIPQQQLMPQLMQGMQGMGMPGADLTGPPPCVIPTGCKMVSMSGRRGWFVPDELAIPPGQGASAPAMGAMGASAPASMGAMGGTMGAPAIGGMGAPPMGGMGAPPMGGMGAPPMSLPVGGTLGMGGEAPPPGAINGDDPYKPGPGSLNPGLNGTQVFVGTVKAPISINNGYGFLDCASIKSKSGRDPFVHVNRVPGVMDMQLQVGEPVFFNMEHVTGENGKTNSFVSRVVRQC